MTRTAIFLTATMSILFSCQNMGNNPFFSEYDTPFAVPPFDEIYTSHYLPAIIQGIEEHNDEIQKIRSSKKDPTFKNTIEELEYSGYSLRKVLDVYNNALTADNSDSLQLIANEAAPILSAHFDEISMDSILFQRVKQVYENKGSLSLNPEEEMLLEETLKTFIRNGANLDRSEKDKLKKINEQLAVSTLKFGNNLLAEDNNWKLIIEDKKDLEGLPEIIIRNAASAAEASGSPGKWVITMHKPSWIPFLQYSSKRNLREKVYKAWMNRGNNDNEYDNKDVIAEIIELRSEKARLLGYNTWAKYRLDNNMAKKPTAVYDLLNQLWEKTMPVALSEKESLQKMIDQEGGGFKLASWDWWYYSEKVRKSKYDLDDEKLRPYFELNASRQGLFYVVEKLYGIKMIEKHDLPKPHPEAFAFEVQEKDGTHIGILYMDFYTRPSKIGGAWMGAYRKQQVRDGEFITPIITNVFNFSKPAGNKPALLTFDEVRTMFHEMGHALHGLLSKCTYVSISGTDVALDFVELPSQIMENWASEPEVLKIYAKHYVTGEPIPQSLIDKMEKSGKFNQGFSMTERLSASILDMSWHNTLFRDKVDPIQFENSVMRELGLMDEIIPRYKSPYFAHIFSSMYSAGYYSYIWAEVLDADAYNAFKETGDIFNPELAGNFREYILAKGGTIEPMELYRHFRGKDPDISAFLKRTGLN